MQFDLARRQQALAAAREAQAQAPSTTARSSNSPAPAAESAPAGQASAKSAPRPLTPKDLEGVGRNDLCPCGSGQKFKKCHGREA
jgi:preprotein translocase subunit SecA